MSLLFFNSPPNARSHWHWIASNTVCLPFFAVANVRLIVITCTVLGAMCSFKTISSCNFVTLVGPVSLNLELDITESSDEKEFAHPLFMSPPIYALGSNTTTSTIESVIIDNNDVQVQTITTTRNTAVATSIGMFHYRIRLKQEEERQYQRLDGSPSDPIVTNVSLDNREQSFCQVYEDHNWSELLVTPFKYPFIFAAQVCSAFAPICGFLSIWIMITDWCCRPSKVATDEAAQKRKKRQPLYLICTCFGSCLSSEVGALLFAGAFQMGTFLIMWEPTFCFMGFGDDRSTMCQIFDLAAHDVNAATMVGSNGGYFSFCGFCCYVGGFLAASCFGVLVESKSRNKTRRKSKIDQAGDNKSTSGGLTPAPSEEQDELHEILPSSSSTATSPTPTNFVVSFQDSPTVPPNVSCDHRHGRQTRRESRGGRSISSRSRYSGADEDVEMGVTHTSSNSTSDVSTTSSSSRHRQSSSRGSVASLRSKFMALDTVVESATSPRYQESSTCSGFLFCNTDTEAASSSTRAPSPPPVIDQEWMDERISSSGSDCDV